MLLIIKRLKDEELMVHKESDIDTIKDTIKLIQLLVTLLKVTRNRNYRGRLCVQRVRVSQLYINANIYQHTSGRA